MLSHLNEIHPPSLSDMGFAARLAGEATQRSCMADLGARVTSSMNGLGTGLNGIFVHMGETMDKRQLDFAILIQAGPRSACVQLISLSVSDFTTASVEIHAATGPLPSSEVGLVRGETLIDLDGS